MGSEKTHGSAGSEIQRGGGITSDSRAGSQQPAANDLGALALFGSEAASNIETPTVGRDASVPGPSQDPVRTLRTKLAADSPSRDSRFLLSPPADLKLAVAGYASTVRSFLSSRVREYLVRHPKLPAQAGLIASIVVAALIVGHYVGRIDVVRINQVPSQPSAPVRGASEPLKAETSAPTPIPPPAVERQPADRTTDVRNTQLAPVAKAPGPMPPPAKAQPPKAQRSTIDIANANSSPRRADISRPREVGRETQTALRNDAAAPVIAPPSSVSSAAPLVAASARPTAALSTPASPVQPATGSPAEFERPGPVYSAQDIDVRPPQMLDADLPRPAVMNWPTVKNSMELLVTADGSVERVKWLTTRERMPDVMLLSRAKLWKFSPALRDGQPVRYRLIVTWEVNP
jgi:hypothetical protein